MNKILVIIVGLIGFINPSAAEENEGYYLSWNNDHTEREIKPKYKINPSEISKHKVYLVKTDEKGKPSSVRYFQYGKESNASDFGGHVLKFTYGHSIIERRFYNINNNQIENSAGVFVERFPVNKMGHYTKKINLGMDGKAVADRFGVGEYHFMKRDEQGRRTKVRHIDVSGKVLKDRFNGFWETELAFDQKDHVKYRKGFDLNNVPMESEEGYATANFWVDSKGDIIAEEFRNLKNERVVVNAGFAKIEFSRDDLGRITEVRYFDENAVFVGPQAAIGRLSYDSLSRRTVIEYFDKDMKPANHRSGVARYVYSYNSDKSFDKRVGFDVNGKTVK